MVVQLIFPGVPISPSVRVAGAILSDLRGPLMGIERRLPGDRGFFGRWAFSRRCGRGEATTSCARSDEGLYPAVRQVAGEMDADQVRTGGRQNVLSDVRTQQRNQGSGVHLPARCYRVGSMGRECRIYSSKHLDRCWRLPLPVSAAAADTSAGRLSCLSTVAERVGGQRALGGHSRACFEPVSGVSVPSRIRPDGARSSPRTLAERALRQCEICTTESDKPFLVEEGQWEAHRASKNHRRRTPRAMQTG